MMTAKRGAKMSEPTHEDVYQFVQEQSCPFVTSGDVGDEWPGVSQRTIRERLNDLAERGELHARRVGANAKVWYIADQSGGASSSSPASVSQ